MAHRRPDEEGLPLDPTARSQEQRIEEMLGQLPPAKAPRVLRAEVMAELRATPPTPAMRLRRRWARLGGWRVPLQLAPVAAAVMVVFFLPQIFNGGVRTTDAGTPRILDVTKQSLVAIADPEWRPLKPGAAALAAEPVESLAHAVEAETQIAAAMPEETPVIEAAPEEVVEIAAAPEPIVPAAAAPPPEPEVVVVDEPEVEEAPPVEIATVLPEEIDLPPPLPEQSPAMEIATRRLDDDAGAGRSDASPARTAPAAAPATAVGTMPLSEGIITADMMREARERATLTPRPSTPPAEPPIPLDCEGDDPEALIEDIETLVEGFRGLVNSRQTVTVDRRVWRVMAEVPRWRVDALRRGLATLTHPDLAAPAAEILAADADAPEPRLAAHRRLVPVQIVIYQRGRSSLE